MKAWVLNGIKDLHLVEKSVPQVKKNEALVKIKSVGICGSDLHYYTDGKIGSFKVDKPIILGHECSGEIVAVGDDVTKVIVGDRVVIDPGITCGTCSYCKSGRYNKCKDIEFMATPPYDGCLCEYVAWPEDLLFKMGDKMSFEEGALIEPFVCAIAGIRRANIPLSSSVTIVGMGPIGLTVLQTLIASGAGEIIAIDVVPFRLEKAKEMGATHVINPLEDDAVQKVMELTGGNGTQFAFETAGTQKTYGQIAKFVADGGTIVAMGLLVDDDVQMPMSSIVINEINIISVFRYANVFKEAVELLKHERVDLKPLISHKFLFERADEAFEFLVNNKDKSIKVIINI